MLFRSIVPDIHLARACANYPAAANLDNCDPPNRADQQNPTQAYYNTQSISRGITTRVPVPFAQQVHTAQWIDPTTGQASKLTVVPAANAMKVKQELLAHNVVLEEFGGQTLSSEISAKKGTNIDALLDQVLLQAEILDLKANPDRKATGSVVEAQLDAGKGPVATVLVDNGTLKVGDDFICGLFSGRVRALLDERGKAVKEAGPAVPVQVLGMTGVPMAGDQFKIGRAHV